MIENDSYTHAHRHKQNKTTTKNQVLIPYLISNNIENTYKSPFLFLLHIACRCMLPDDEGGTAFFSSGALDEPLMTAVLNKLLVEPKKLQMHLWSLKS